MIFLTYCKLSLKFNDSISIMNIYPYLSSDQLATIDRFHSEKDALFITGPPGAGKTSLALELLKDTILLRIDSSLIKQHKDLSQYILNSIRKRNITLMFQQKQNRSILFDDLDIFQKHDKPGFKHMIQFLKDNQFYNSKVVVIFPNKFQKNKELVKILSDKKQKKNILRLNYSYPIYYRIMQDMLSSKNISLSSSEMDTLLYTTNFNLNVVISNVKIKQDKQIKKTDIQIDTYDLVEDVTQNIINERYEFNDLMRYTENDATVIGLNLLENCHHIIDPTYYTWLSSIYEFHSAADRLETYMTSEHEWEFRDYLAPLTVYPIHYAIHEYSYHKNKKNILYNKYISKSLINVHSQKTSRYSENKYERIIYYLIYFAYHQSVDDSKNPKLMKLFQSMKKKDLQRFCKTFEYFYGYKLSANNLTS
tara:strand:+ start:2742 stop:4004 length:1263 start_codon:yes stop_codon:yes gene_type:complete